MKNRIKNITLGTDPEVFIKISETGKIISAEGIIGGTKEIPIPVTDKGHCIQEDNVMAEFCIPPCKTEDEFYHNINFMLNYLRSNTPAGLDIEISASAILDSIYLNTIQAKRFGCDPDFNAYTSLRNDAPNSNTNLRTCGGHIHIGYNNPDEETSMQIIKALDLFLGVPSVIMDLDVKRRTMYGKAGAFRLKPYGVEYRSLSNFWLQDEFHIRWAFNNTMLALKWLNKGNSIDETLGKEIQDAINNDDVEEASALIGSMNIPFIETVIKSYEKTTKKVKKEKVLI